MQNRSRAHRKLPQPGEQAGEVVAHRGEDGVVGVAVRMSEVVALHPVLVLDVADDGLDGGASSDSRLMGSVTPRFWSET